MLPAENRLRRSADFATTVRAGARAGRRRVVVHVLAPGLVDSSPAPVQTEVGFVVSRAVGGAVVRNRVKRRLRHLVAARLDVPPPGSRMVVRALPAAADSSAAELAADLDRALGRALQRLRPAGRP